MADPSVSLILQRTGPRSNPGGPGPYRRLHALAAFRAPCRPPQGGAMQDAAPRPAIPVAPSLL